MPYFDETTKQKLFTLIDSIDDKQKGNLLAFLVGRLQTQENLTLEDFQEAFMKFQLMGNWNSVSEKI